MSLSLLSRVARPSSPDNARQLHAAPGHWLPMSLPSGLAVHWQASCCSSHLEYSTNEQQFVPVLSIDRAGSLDCYQCMLLLLLLRSRVRRATIALLPWLRTFQWSSSIPLCYQVKGF